MFSIMAFIFTISNRVDDKLLPAASHATRTPEFTGSTTTVSKLHFASLPLIIVVFPLACCFVYPPPSQKQLFILSVWQQKHVINH